MTCSSCTTAVTNTLSELPGVLDVCVSLLSGPIVQAVDDCGFEVEIIKVESFQALNAVKSQENIRRTVSLRVDGMVSQYAAFSDILLSFFY
jgi:Cu+-exporting ATPase